jgi:hypothetical protein
MSFAESPLAKYQARSSDRWTIADWFETKRQVSLMDQWLTRNRKTKNIFDFELGAAQQEIESTFTSAGGIVTESESTYQGVNLSMYFYFVGVEGSYYEDKDNDENLHYSSSVNLRLLGSNNQTTRWVIYYGSHSVESAIDTWQPNYYGTRLSVYITKFLGIEGNYLKYIEEESDLGLMGEGSRQDFSIFLDIYFLRLYGKWIDEELEFTNPLDQITTEEHKGFEAGFTFFF